MRTPEFFEKKAIKEFLDELGPDRCSYFSPYMAGYGKTGIGDIVACIIGTYWNIEVKRPGKEPTVIQERRAAEIRRAGGRSVAGTAEIVIQVLRDWLSVRGIVV